MYWILKPRLLLPATLHAFLPERKVTSYTCLLVLVLIFEGYEFFFYGSRTKYTTMKTVCAA